MSGFRQEGRELARLGAELSNLIAALNEIRRISLVAPAITQESIASAVGRAENAIGVIRAFLNAPRSEPYNDQPTSPETIDPREQRNRDIQI